MLSSQLTRRIAQGYLSWLSNGAKLKPIRMGSNKNIFIIFGLDLGVKMKHFGKTLGKDQCFYPNGPGVSVSRITNNHFFV